ncbi:hypothetical protein AGLY_004600 [Aphis glycines]|uniref:Uncharacterized protein n=1 Tax=Aphis glycines TaxID=307491 RepID=A0A6G0TUC6_APHGL|nr:hypothetical protein AGLY_004600 [Aphis glycines]
MIILFSLNDEIIMVFKYFSTELTSKIRTGGILHVINLTLKSTISGNRWNLQTPVHLYIIMVHYQLDLDADKKNTYKIITPIGVYLPKNRYPNTVSQYLTSIPFNFFITYIFVRNISQIHFQIQIKFNATNKYKMFELNIVIFFLKNIEIVITYSIGNHFNLETFETDLQVPNIELVLEKQYNKVGKNLLLLASGCNNVLINVITNFNRNAFTRLTTVGRRRNFNLTLQSLCSYICSLIISLRCVYALPNPNS